MSEPTRDVYDPSHGMDAHNLVMRDIRSKREERWDPTEPTRVWIDEDRTPTGTYSSLTIILNTGGCRWARAGGCTMCGYVAESVESGSVTDDQLLSQLNVALAHERDNGEGPCEMIKIYTSGSFLDDREVSPAVRERVFETFSERERIVLESLPDFVTEETMAECASVDAAVDIAIGLETATDRIRRDCINKYFDFDAFVAAGERANAAGVGIKAYLLLKPPFVTEQEAIDDMISSIERCLEVPACHTVSMNPCNVQRYTMVDELFYRGGYRPPWLWSVVAVLRETADAPGLVVSDPVGGGSERGPHNCGECDQRVCDAISHFNLTGDASVFDRVSCDCESTWEAVCDRETGYNQPLTR